MRIGLNLLHALPEIEGGWNYISNLISALGEYDETNTYVAFVTNVSERLVPAKPNFISVRVNIRSVSRVQRIFYENTLLQLQVHKHKLDCMHWFANTQALVNVVPGVVTVYDLQPFLNFAPFSLTKRLYLRIMMSLTSRKASVLLPMSQATAQGLQCVLNADPARMVVIHPVVSSQFMPAQSEVIGRFETKYGLPENFWLYVAHMYPHKNHLRLLQAYHGLKLNGFAPWPLVLRGDPKGGEAAVMEMITLLNLERDVIILPRLNCEDLPILYSAATALVFPSLYEGGGIPVIEAMACGCPVTASDIPAVRELASGAASYFNPLDIKAIGNAMMELQNNSEKREASRHASLVRSTEFTAREVIGKLVGAYGRAQKR